jgi:hypothetical protein
VCAIKVEHSRLRAGWIAMRNPFAANKVNMVLFQGVNARRKGVEFHFKSDVAVLAQEQCV